MLQGVRVPDQPPAKPWDWTLQLPEGWRRFCLPAAVTGPGTIAVFRRRLQDFADERYRKLLSHFGEAGTTVLVIKHVEYGGHDRTPS